MLPVGFEIRLALPSDKDGVLAFCRHTFDWGDYIEDVWDQWIADRQSTLLVGVLDGRQAAVGHVRLLTPDEAWMEGLRVDPAVRGKGIAHAFTARAVAAAASLGAKVARLATLSTNATIHHVVADLGFHHVSGFVPFHGDIASGQPAATLSEQDLPDLVAYLASSSVFRAAGGLYCSGWACQALTQVKLRSLLVAGSVAGRRDAGGELTAFAVMGRSYDGRAHVVEYADGRDGELTALAASLLSCAAGLRATLLEARLTDVALVIQAFESAGYLSDGHEPFWVYAKELAVPGG